MIKYLMNKPLVHGRIVRWLLLLHEFNIKIINKLGKSNIVANFISKLTTLEEDEKVNDKFLDENFFSLSTTSPWYVDMANYLAIGKFPIFLHQSKRSN